MLSCGPACLGLLESAPDELASHCSQRVPHCQCQRLFQHDIQGSSETDHARMEIQHSMSWYSTDGVAQEDFTSANDIWRSPRRPERARGAVAPTLAAAAPASAPCQAQLRRSEGPLVELLTVQRMCGNVKHSSSSTQREHISRECCTTNAPRSRPPCQSTCRRVVLSRRCNALTVCSESLD